MMLVILLACILLVILLSTTKSPYEKMSPFGTGRTLSTEDGPQILDVFPIVPAWENEITLASLEQELHPQILTNGAESLQLLDNPLQTLPTIQEDSE